MNRLIRPVMHIALLASASALGLAGVAPAQTSDAPAVRDVAAELACGPHAAGTLPADPIRLGGGATAGKVLFGLGDAVVVRGGAPQGLQTGQQYFVRRVVPDRFTPSVSDGITLYSVHTAGWIRIDEVARETAAGRVTYACDALMEGDYLEPFALPAVPSASVQGTADFEHPGRIILGDERRQLGAVGSLMVLDRGSDHGLRPGQRVTVFRPWPAAGPVVRVGEATAMIVRPDTTLLRIEQSSDAIYVGDLVAIHR